MGNLKVFEELVEASGLVDINDPDADENTGLMHAEILASIASDWVQEFLWKAFNDEDLIIVDGALTFKGKTERTHTEERSYLRPGDRDPQNALDEQVEFTLTAPETVSFKFHVPLNLNLLRNALDNWAKLKLHKHLQWGRVSNIGGKLADFVEKVIWPDLDGGFEGIEIGNSDALFEMISDAIGDEVEVDTDSDQDYVDDSPSWGLQSVAFNVELQRAKADSGEVDFQGVIQADLTVDFHYPNNPTPFLRQRRRSSATCRVADRYLTAQNTAQASQQRMRGKTAGPVPVIRLNAADQKVLMVFRKAKKNPAEIGVYLTRNVPAAQRLVDLSKNEWLHVMWGWYDTQAEALSNATRDIANEMRVHPERRVRLVGVLEWYFPRLDARGQQGSSSEMSVWQAITAVLV